jgi:hypothetical protein
MGYDKELFDTTNGVTRESMEFVVGLLKDEGGTPEQIAQFLRDDLPYAYDPETDTVIEKEKAAQTG